MRTTTLALMALMLGGTLAGGCNPHDARDIARIADLEAQLRDAQGERTRLDTRISEIEGQNAEMVARLRALGQSVEDLESARATLESERTALRGTLDETERALEELRERERQQQARLATFRAMLERFRAMIDAGRLRVRIVRNRMVVELPDNVLFDSGDSELREQGQATLAEVATVLRTIEGRQFQVAGHTDDVPIHSRRFPSNWELSTARAVSVARFLLEQGIPTERISAAGYAESQPIDMTGTPEGRARNRRIEIQLVPNLDELPDLSSLVGERGETSGH